MHYKSGVYLLCVVVLIGGLLPVSTIVAQDARPITINSFTWNPAGTELAVGADNGVFIYDNDFQLLRYQEVEQAVYGLGWSPEGTRLIVGSQIRDANTLNLLVDLEYSLYGWLYGGTHVYTSSGKEIKIFDANDGHQVKIVPLEIQVEGLVPRLGGTQLISGIGSRIAILDTDSGRVTTAYSLPGSIFTYDVSSDGTMIAYSASRTVPAGTLGSTPLPLEPGLATLNILNIIDTNTGESLAIHNLPPDPVFRLSWSRDGSKITGVSDAGLVYIWDASNGHLIQTIQDDEPIYKAKFSPDGTYLIIYSGEGGTLETVDVLPAPLLAPDS